MKIDFEDLKEKIEEIVSVSIIESRCHLALALIQSYDEFDRSLEIERFLVDAQATFLSRSEALYDSLEKMFCESEHTEAPPAAEESRQSSEPKMSDEMASYSVYVLSVPEDFLRELARHARYEGPEYKGKIVYHGDTSEWVDESFDGGCACGYSNAASEFLDALGVDPHDEELLQWRGGRDSNPRPPA